MLVVANSILGEIKFLLVEMIENLSLYSKELELGQSTWVAIDMKTRATLE